MKGDQVMKRMILGTMMCMMIAIGVSAQEQDTVAKQEFRHHRHPRMEMRMHGDFHRADSMPMAKRHGMHRGHFCRPEGCAKFKDITPEQMAEFRADMLTRQLTLTDKQNKKLRDVFMDEAKAIKDKKATPEEQKAKTDKKVKRILTDAQYAKYQEMGKRQFACKNKPHILPFNHPNHPQHRRHQHFDNSNRPQRQSPDTL